ncbi:hypothetical protein DMB66_33225 [Actinoplanes sp. ATCC 53533]|uniref:AAA family ATPase n=1 Tax=Actinoplanes sp. ATCC 53533 TaxID=1288362 RepID=UPI000F7A4235|nr:AAA family ATPase [Actinoplanes sp. ATCC 53533]RSM56713.1 hypothetical protein DMB66_33225 [Actinoplanes sp. ATCC 53533]
MTTVDEDILRRHFVAIATGDYDDPHWRPLPVEKEVAALRQWLCSPGLGRRGFSLAYPELADNPSEDQIRVLKNVARKTVWTDADAVVLFVTGHGEQADDSHYLILRDSVSSIVSSTALRTSELIGWLADTAVQHMLIILDACYAGSVARDVLRLGKRPHRRWLILPSATRDEKAVTGALTEAIVKFLDGLNTPEGRRYGEHKYLNVNDFLDDVQQNLGEHQTLIPLYGGQLTGPHPCLPNPHYQQDEAVPVDAARHSLALPRQDLATHWSPRARGVGSDEQPGWLFTGRAVLMRELISAAATAGATVVTGGAGSGKSAVLARLVTLSDPRFLRQYAGDVAAIPDELRPAEGAVDVAVLATGKLHTQVLAEICHALQVPVAAGPIDPSVQDRLHAWHDWLARQDRPVTLVIDALDEATDPRSLVREVIAKLEPDRDRPRLRLLVGVRSLATGEHPATASAAAVLTDETVTTLDARRIAVDDAPWWDQHDIVAYVHSILRHTPGSPYPAAPEQVIADVAQALGNRAGRSFLIARIAASSLTDRDTVIAADDPGWLTALDQGVLGVFRQDLHQTLREADDRYRAVILLRAVAFAYGAGLPWRGIWPLVAHAVDDNDGHYGDADIAWLLNSRLGAYLVTDREDDVTVYRLFHDLLRSTLRERWRELLQTPSTSSS